MMRRGHLARMRDCVACSRKRVALGGYFWLLAWASWLTLEPLSANLLIKDYPLPQTIKGSLRIKKEDIYKVSLQTIKEGRSIEPHHIYPPNLCLLATRKQLDILPRIRWHKGSATS